MFPQWKPPTEKHGTSTLPAGQGQCHHYIALTKGRAIVLPDLWSPSVGRSALGSGGAWPDEAWRPTASPHLITHWSVTWPQR